MLTSDFITFLKKNDIVAITIATLLSNRVSNLTESLVENIMLPFLDFDINNNGVSDKKELEKVEFNIKGVKLKIGKVFVAIIKFILITYIIYFMIIISSKIL